MPATDAPLGSSLEPLHEGLSPVCGERFEAGDNVARFVRLFAHRKGQKVKTEIFQLYQRAGLFAVLAETGFELGRSFFREGNYPMAKACKNRAQIDKAEADRLLAMAKEKEALCARR
jgi:hypothetical protein